MKQIILLALLGLCIASKAQDQLYLSISNDSPNSVQISWTNDDGVTYRIFYTSDLAVPRTNWSPYEDAFSGDTNVSVGVSTKDSDNRFFIVQNPADNGVQIYSPTNNQTVNGAIMVRAGAQIGGQPEEVNLYLDGSQVGYINSGAVAFYLDTTHYTNGLHTLFVSAVNPVNGQTMSSPITLDFENPVRWLDADSLFDSFVPIDVEADFSPADWIISVQDTNGVAIRTFSGTTSDGMISTNWDGKDDGGSDVPSEASYKVTIVVAPSGSSPAETLLAKHSTLGFSPLDSGSSSSSGSSSTVVWRETHWNSGEIILVRQKLTALTSLPFDAAAANLLNNVLDLVGLAQDQVDGDRSPYQDQVMTMQHNGDFGPVKDAIALSNPNTREFYFWGHGARDGNSIGFKEGTPGDGITVKDVNSLLGNSYQPAKDGQPALFTTTKPFDFVFLDGCMLGVGSFPEAFGIPKAALHFSSNNKHKRAYMGWAGTISFSILDTESINWSLSFWQSWLDNVNQPVGNAVTTAFQQHPSGGDGVPMEIYGDPSLTWKD